MKRLIPVLVIAWTSIAKAEGGCPDGQYPQQGQGWQACIPIPGYQTPVVPMEPQRPVRDGWGAVAGTDDGVPLGQSTNQSSEQAAIRDAIEECKANGGDGCRKYITYKNQCVALASGDDRIKYSFSDISEGDAIRRSMKKCTKAKISNCHTYYSGCSYPYVR